MFILLLMLFQVQKNFVVVVYIFVFDVYFVVNVVSGSEELCCCSLHC
jgi:hypothetical protein